MHLRRLIVLIINARNIISSIRSCTAKTSIIGLMFLYPTHHCIGLIGQIKKTRIHVQSLFLPEGVGSNRQCCISLRCRKIRSWNPRVQHNQTLLFVSHAFVPIAEPSAISVQIHSKRSLVEPDGIEPTTSCLQSRRSPS